MKKTFWIYFKNRKGDIITDTLTFVGFIFVFALLAYLVYPFLQDINTDVQNDASYTATSKTHFSSFTTRYPKMVDGMFVVFVIIFTVLIGLTSFFLDTNPIFFVIALILLVVLLFVGAVLSNTHAEITEDSDYTNVKTLYPNMDRILNNLPALILFEFAMVALILYSKRGD
ncbi:hypothetical protein ES702_02773 [subsurface metagenome]